MSMNLKKETSDDELQHYDAMNELKDAKVYLVAVQDGEGTTIKGNASTCFLASVIDDILNTHPDVAMLLALKRLEELR